MATTGTPIIARSQKFPNVPMPDTTLEGLQRSVLALKQCVQMLTGYDNSSRDGTRADRFAPHVFVQATAPEALHEGDLWLCNQGSMTFNIWSAGKWLVIATLPAVP